MIYDNDTAHQAAATDALDLGNDEPKLEVPAEWHDKYTEQDRADTRRVIGWLNKAQKPQSWLARISRVNVGTLNQVVRGNYAASPSKFLAQMLEAIASNDERTATRDVPFVETSVYKLAASVYHRARTYRNLGVLTCSVGTGKTTAASEYERRTPNVHLIECMRNMSASAFLDELCAKLSLAAETRGQSKEKKFFACVRSLRGTESLLIVDEAETVLPETLHYIRRIRDMARIGIVLQGTEDLLAQIKPEHGRFGQIRSRIGFWPEAVGSISRQDADELALAAFEEIEVDQPSLDAMWDVGGGSARLLCEALIPAIRDYGLRKGRPLSAGLVRQVAIEALKIQPRNVRPVRK